MFIKNVIASVKGFWAKQSRNLFTLHWIAASLTLLAMTKKGSLT